MYFQNPWKNSPHPSILDLSHIKPMDAWPGIKFATEIRYHYGMILTLRIFTNWLSIWLVLGRF